MLGLLGETKPFEGTWVNTCGLEHNWKHCSRRASLGSTANHGQYARWYERPGLEWCTGIDPTNVFLSHYYCPHVSNQCSGDLIHAAISSAKPKFNAPDVTTNPLTGMMPPSILEQPLDIHDTDSFKAAVTTLVELYAHLSALQSHIFANPSIRTELFLPFTQLSIVLEHRLLSLVKPLHLDAKTALYAAAHITLIMCAFLIFRIFPLRTSVLETLQTRLGPTLIPLDMSIENLLDSKELKMLLWVQWVGALAALEQEWYVARIKESMKALGVSEWDGLKEVLECFVWNARLEDSACWELCDRVGISNS